MLWKVLELFNEFFWKKKFNYVPKIETEKSPKKIMCLKNKIIWFKIDENFWQRILLWIIVVSAKELWDIRISLNVMRGTRIFKDILWKNVLIYQKGVKWKCLKNSFKNI